TRAPRAPAPGAPRKSRSPWVLRGCRPLRLSRDLIFDCGARRGQTSRSFGPRRTPNAVSSRVECARPLGGDMRTLLLWSSLLLLSWIASPASAIAMDWTSVGNPGNGPDPQTGYGSVGYAYSIGTY